ncbi:hypothetical protein DFH07DRAFT_767358 [Mycena maculata]|uniref:Uncharacterized protein n=1 Tax=Mycena maculata TaxID=230809 RepID=A0AAD7JXS5_9AGAR|nr:hypothetical protein DFH07DRAFT_767358 [Mycena maculata]
MAMLTICTQSADSESRRAERRLMMKDRSVSMERDGRGGKNSEWGHDTSMECAFSPLCAQGSGLRETYAAQRSSSTTSYPISLFSADACLCLRVEDHLRSRRAALPSQKRGCACKLWILRKRSAGFPEIRSSTRRDGVEECAIGYPQIPPHLGGVAFWSVLCLEGLFTSDTIVDSGQRLVCVDVSRGIPELRSCNENLFKIIRAITALLPNLTFPSTQHPRGYVHPALVLLITMPDPAHLLNKWFRRYRKP